MNENGNETTTLRSSLDSILLILSYETLRLTPYDDGLGYQTVGWGHRTSSYDQISREVANQLFLDDLSKAEAAVREGVGEEAWGKLTPHQIGALTSLTFNIGRSAFLGSSVARAVREGRLGDVPAAMMLWVKGTVKGRKVTIRGLVNRREAEVRVWAKGKLVWAKGKP